MRNSNFSNLVERFISGFSTILLQAAALLLFYNLILKTHVVINDLEYLDCVLIVAIFRFIRSIEFQINHFNERDGDNW